VLADPPVLVSPIGGAQASPTPLLQWTPSNPPAPVLQYQVTLKVRYRGQTLAQAMASNPVRLQATVPTTSYQVTFAQQLGVDAADPNYAGHVWQVQALLNGRPYGRNRGLSQIEWFVVPPIAVDTVKPSDGRPIALVEWEVPYEEIRPGRPIKLQVPPIQEDTVLYVLRVRVPEKLSLQQLEQLRKNWAHEVRKEISTMRERQVLDDVGDMVQISNRMVDSRRGPKPAGILCIAPSFRMVEVDSTRKTRPVRVYLADTYSRYRMVDSTRRPRGRIAFIMRDDFYPLYRMVDSTRKPRGVPYILVDHGKIPLRTHQDTSGVQSYPPKYEELYDLDGTPQDTAGAGVDRTRYTGGYFLYALPQDTTKPAELVDYYVPNGTPQGTAEPASAARINIKPLADRVVVEPAPAEDRRGPILVMGRFTPTHVGLRMPELGLDPGDRPVCDIPARGEDTVRHIRFVLNQAIASGAGPTGKTLGAVARQAPPQGGTPVPNDSFAVDPIPPRDSIRLHTYAPIPLLGPPTIPPRPPIPPLVGVAEGVPVLWPNGNPPRDPDWPWVGVIGTPVLEGIDGAPGPGKPQNWCGTEYIWTGPRPKSPKELILTPVIPRPR
jgi:hypothetical protein